MSLINDALRRAQQSQSDPPPAPSAPPAALPPLEPAEPAPLSPWSSLLPVLLVGLLAVGVLGAGGWFAWKAWDAMKTKKAAASLPNRLSPVTQAAPSAGPKTNSTTIPTKTNLVVAAASPPALATNQSPALPATNAPTIVFVPAPPPVKWPPLRLQGIFYKPSSPSVVINNRTLYVNEMIDGVRLVAIDRSKVTLVLGGQTNFMMLR